MKGHYNIKLLNAQGLSDEDFHNAQKNGTIEELLANLEIIKEFDHSNQLSHHIAGNVFWRLFGAPNPSAGVTIQDGNYFHYMGFGNSAAEYDYTFSEYSGDLYNLFIRPNGNVADADIKRTSAAIRTHQVLVEPDATGLRAVYDVHRFLWTPGQVNSSEIREVKWASTDDQGDGWYWNDECRTTSRTRIKDSNGNPYTITKTSSEVILVQWTLTMKSI